MSNIKFYEQNIVSSDTAFSLTTALTASAKYLYDENDTTKLTSVASSDTVSEIWDMDFGASYSLTALHLANHNLKDFSIQYWSSSAFVDFSTAINTTTNSGTYGYFEEFTNVTTQKVRITGNKTIVADEQKSVGGLRVMNLIGEMDHNPKKFKLKYQENSKKFYTDAKESVFVLFGTSRKINTNFENLDADNINILQNVKFKGSPIYVYASGGDDTHERRGWRIQDIYLMNYTNAFEPKLSDDALHNGEDIKCIFEGVKPFTS